jgi:hypothetical protein
MEGGTVERGEDGRGPLSVFCAPFGRPAKIDSPPCRKYGTPNHFRSL